MNENENEFLIVSNQKLKNRGKKNLTDIHPCITDKIPMKIVGRKTCDSSLKASKTIVKKKTYHLAGLLTLPFQNSAALRYRYQSY